MKWTIQAHWRVYKSGDPYISEHRKVSRGLKSIYKRSLPSQRLRIVNAAGAEGPCAVNLDGKWKNLNVGTDDARALIISSLVPNFLSIHVSWVVESHLIRSASFIYILSIPHNTYLSSQRTTPMAHFTYLTNSVLGSSHKFEISKAFQTFQIYSRRHGTYNT